MDCEIGYDFTDVGYNWNNKAKSTVIFPRWIVSHLGGFTLTNHISKFQILTPQQGYYLAELFIFHHIQYIVLFGSISCASYTTYGIENGNDEIFRNFLP